MARSLHAIPSRALPAAETRLLEDIYCPRDMELTEWRNRFQSYADSFSLCANIPTYLAMQLLRVQLHELLIAGPIVPDAIHVALQRAVAVAKAQRLTNPTSALGRETPAENPTATPTRVGTVVANSAAEFIENQLGAGVRAMTVQELIRHDTATKSSHLYGKQSAPPPDHLQDFWECYILATCRADHGNFLSARDVLMADYRAACQELHARACRKAASTRTVNGQLYPAVLDSAAAQAPAPAPAQAQAQEEAPAQAQAQEGAPAQAPAPAHAQKLEGAAEPAPIHLALPALTPPRPLALFQTPEHHPAPLAIQTSLHTAPSPVTFSSPFARLAADRETRSIAAKSSAQTLIIMPNNSAKTMQWKTGEEKDGKGFYWSTKLAVQQAWEQHNLVEEPQNYRTFRSTIHVQMIPIICFELKISRQAFDVISDSDLIEKLDAKLKPSGPIEYLLKLRQIKFNNSAAGGSLLHRYRAFAEPFLQLVAESTEAGCDMNEESVKLAFKAACRGNDLLMTFLQEGKWQGVVDAHQRIVEQLRRFNTLQTMNSLNGSPSDIPQPQFVAPPRNTKSHRHLLQQYHNQ